MLKTLIMKAAFTAFLGCISFVAFAVADTQRFAVPAGDLAAALESFAKQANVDLVYQETQVKGLRTKGVSGTFSAQEAVAKLLEGTPLQLRTDEASGAILITTPSDGPALTSDYPSGATTPLPGGDREGTRGAGGVRETRIARAGDRSDESSKADASRSAAGQELPRPEEIGKAIPEILVKGSRTLNTELKRDKDDVQPYVVFGRDEIARSGASDVETFLKGRLTAATASPTPSQVPAGSYGVGTSFNLRGLGPEETLILINGRRAVSNNLGGAPGQADIGGIPLSAIERIEVLPSTASGIFGGGATGGAINVVLKQNYNGLDVSAFFENTIDASAPISKISLTAGVSPADGKTSMMVTGTFSEADSLYVSDRDFAQAARQLTLENNPSAILSSRTPPLGATTNIRSTTGVLQLKPEFGGAVLPVNYTFVPAGYSGIGSDNGAALVASAGQYNLEPANTAQAFGGRQGLLTGPTVKSLSTTIRRLFTDRIEAFGEFWVSENTASHIVNGATASYTLPSSATTNPFVQSVRITAPALGLDSVSSSKIVNRRAVAGLSAQLGAGWSLGAEYSWGQSKFSREGAGPFLSAPGAADVAAGNIDLIRDTNLFPVDFSLYVPEATSVPPASATLKNPSLRIAGHIPLALPGGEPTLAVTAEYRREEFGDAYSLVPPPFPSYYYPARRQSTRSVYLESRLALVSQNNPLPGVKLAEVQVAVRNDRYETEAANTIDLADPTPGAQDVRTSRGEFSSTDPTVGLKYSPGAGFTFRGSFATGFVAPSVEQLVPSPSYVQFVTEDFGFVDPRRGGEFITGDVLFSYGGSPELLPEEARSWTIGVIFAPEFLRGLRLSIDRTEVEKTDNIDFLDIDQLLLNEASIPERVTRAPATPENDPQGYGVGPVVGLDTSLVNIARTDIEALDITLDYEWTTAGLGSGQLSLRGTRTVHKIDQVTPAAEPRENLGLASSLRWVAHASLDWNLRDWGAGWETQYYDKYWLSPTHQVIANQGAAEIPSQIYHNVYFSFRRPPQRQNGFESGASWLSGLSCQVGIKNVFDTRPPIVAAEPGYSMLGDPRMSRYYMSLQKSF